VWLNNKTQMTFHTLQQYKSRTSEVTEKITKKMLLLADNHTVYPHTQDLPSVTLVFLSRNATFDFQLMNVEIMASSTCQEISDCPID
jgi:hypothetical protein